MLQVNYWKHDLEQDIKNRMRIHDEMRKTYEGYGNFSCALHHLKIYGIFLELMREFMS